MNKNLINRPIAKEVALDLESSDALDYYLAQLRETPLLTKEQEEELFSRLQNADDMDAARKLVMSHLRICCPHCKNIQRLWSSFIRYNPRGKCRLNESCQKI